MNGLIQHLAVSGVFNITITEDNYIDSAGGRNSISYLANYNANYYVLATINDTIYSWSNRAYIVLLCEYNNSTQRFEEMFRVEHKATTGAYCIASVTNTISGVFRDAYEQVNSASVYGIYLKSI